VRPVAEDVEGAFSDDDSTIEFSIPRNLPLGTYQVEVFVTATAAETALAPPDAASSEEKVTLAASVGPFVVTRETPVAITSVHPVVSFPDKKQFQFRVAGNGFSAIGEDNLLVVDKVGTFRQCVEPGIPAGCVEVLADDDGRELLFTGFAPGDVTGLQKIRIRVGRSVSEPVEVRLSRVGRVFPTWAALATVLVLSLLVWAFLLPMRRMRTNPGPSGLATTLFLDPETNTYSLSKLQVYVWMAVTVFAYAYLTAAYTFVQGHDDFPKFPDNLPGVLLISVGTGVLATGITAAKGSKGAGSFQPSFADFLTSGGVLASDRLQFFGWTIVGAVGFVMLVLLRAPETIEGLPTIPDGLLTLMGISSAGYLGGKLARKAGPVIKQIVALFGSPLTIEIRGENLSQNATLILDETPLTKAHLDPTLHPAARPIGEGGDPGSEFVRVLKVTIPMPPLEWQLGKHTMTLVNPDGQRAVWPFEVVSREVAARAIPTSSSQPMLPPSEPPIP